jgi:hypothetical protein
MLCDTGAMAYHETFWLAISATAPVIALAVTVSLSDTLRLIDGNSRPDKSSPAKAEPGTWVVYWASALSCTNLASQLVFLFYALKSISSSKDLGGGLAQIIWAEPIGIALLLVVAILNAAARLRISKAQVGAENTTATDR